MTARAARGTGLVVLVAGVVAALAGVPSVGAQGPATQTGARLVVTAIDGTVGPGVAEGADEDLDLRVLVENTGDADLSNLQVVAEVHEAVGARSVLQQALDEQTLDTRLLGLRRADVRDGGRVGTGEVAGVEVTVPADRIGWQGTNQVHPVQVSVLLGAEVLDRVVTGVVHLADPPDDPLRTAVVWPVDAPTHRTPRGRYEEALPEELAPGGRIDVLLAALEQHPEAPVLLAPGASLVEELADRANGFTLADGSRVDADARPARRADDLLSRLRELVAQSPTDPVLGPYGGADVAALAEGPPEVAALADVAVEAARTRTQALLGRAPDLGLYLGSTPVTPTLLQRLVADRVLLSYDQVVGPALDTYPDLPSADRRLAAISGQGTPERATVADPHVAEVLVDPPTRAGPTIARQRLVAETALLYLAEPGRAGRSLLVMPPTTTWGPAGTTAQHLLDALVASPWLALGRPDGPGPPDPAVLASPETGLSDTVTRELVETQESLEALRQAMPEGSDALGDQTVADLEDALLRAVTPRALRGNGEAAREQVEAVAEVAASAFGEVELAEGSTVTLTSETGEVPVTLERTAGTDIELLVEVQSPNALQWSEEARQQRITLPADESRTLSFSTRALSRGTFPVTVYVWDPTHDRLLDWTTISVRSTAISRTALVVVGSAVVLLLAVGLWRRRSPRRLEVVR